MNLCESGADEPVDVVAIVCERADRGEKKETQRKGAPSKAPAAWRVMRGKRWLAVGNVFKDAAAQFVHAPITPAPLRG
jgi:hypothetical protein